jgi:hypothetical protein
VHVNVCPNIGNPLDSQTELTVHVEPQIPPKRPLSSHLLPTAIVSTAVFAAAAADATATSASATATTANLPLLLPLVVDCCLPAVSTATIVFDNA